MSRYPALTGRKVISFFRNKGFDSVRQEGRHVLMRHPDRRATVVPVHSRETIGPGLLGKILRDAELTMDESMQRD